MSDERHEFWLLPIDIETGQALVNEDMGAAVCTRHDDVMLVILDMHTKYCRVPLVSVVHVGGSPVPLVTIEPTEDSYPLADSEHWWTHVTFPTLTGWRVWLAECSRYTVRIAFVADDCHW